MDIHAPSPAYTPMPIENQTPAQHQETITKMIVLSAKHTKNPSVVHKLVDRLEKCEAGDCHCAPVPNDVHFQTYLSIVEGGFRL